MGDKDVKLPYKLPTFHDWQPHASFYHPLYAGSIDGTDVYPHDKAVIRAMLSTYRPNKNVTGDQSKTLFVARLSKDTGEDEVQKIFEKYGHLEKCRLIRDFVTGFSKGYAFVEYKKKKDALYAAREAHQMNINGRQILVDFECERNLEGWKPRRFGGGFGGKKESGQLRFGGIDRPFRRPLPQNVSHFDRSQPLKTSNNAEDHGKRDREEGYDRSRSGHEKERWDRNQRDIKGSDQRSSKKGRDDHRERREYRDHVEKRRQREEVKSDGRQVHCERDQCKDRHKFHNRYRDRSPRKDKRDKKTHRHSEKYDNSRQ